MKYIFFLVQKKKKKKKKIYIYIYIYMLFLYYSYLFLKLKIYKLLFNLEFITKDIFNFNLKLNN